MKTITVLYDFQAHQGGTTSVAFSPGGTILASGSYDGTIRLWYIKTGKLKQVLGGHRRGHVTFSPDALTLVSGGLHRDAVVYDALTLQERQTLGNTASAWGMAFTPNGKRLAIIQPDMSVQMWDTQTWQIVEEIETGQQYVYALAFASAGDRRALAVAEQGHVCILNGNLTEEIAVFTAHEPFTYGLSFDPEGKWLASVGADSKMRLWDATTWHLEAEVSHTAPLLCVAISPDGRSAAFGSLDGTLTICAIK